MNILLLGGVSDSNKQWVGEWAELLRGHGHVVEAVHYDHWGFPEKAFDFEIESEKISRLGEEFKRGIVVAKSIGSVLAVYATHQQIIFPDKAVFLGFPVKSNGQAVSTMKIDLEAWLKDYRVSTKVYQNQDDPVTNFEEAKSALQNFAGEAFTSGVVKIEAVPGDTHKYPPEIYFEKVITAN
jgi:hypothetical protein